MSDFDCLFCKKFEKINVKSKCILCKAKEKNLPKLNIENLFIKKDFKKVMNFHGSITEKQKKYLIRIYKERKVNYTQDEVDSLTTKEASKLIDKWQTPEMKKRKNKMKSKKIIGGDMDDILHDLFMSDSIQEGGKWEDSITSKQKKLLSRLLRTSKINTTNSEIDSLSKAEASALIDFILKY